MTIMFISNPLEQQLCSFPNLEFWIKKYHQKIWYMPISICLFPILLFCHLCLNPYAILHLIFFQSFNECSVGHNLIISVFHYSSVLNRSHRATFWKFDPNYSLPNVTQKKDNLRSPLGPDQSSTRHSYGTLKVGCTGTRQWFYRLISGHFFLHLVKFLAKTANKTKILAELGQVMTNLG